MSLKKLRHNTLTERKEHAKSLKRFGRQLSRSRLKTSAVDQNPELTNRFQQQLSEHGISSSFLRNLFEKRCDQNQIRPEEDKYRIFTRHFLSKMQRTFEVSELRLKQASMVYFLKGIMRNEEIVGLDLSNSKFTSVSPITELITYSESICKLHLCNISLQPKDFGLIFDKVTEMERVIHLDLSNRTFEGANKIGEAYQGLTKFVQNNKVIQILQLQGLSIRDKGLEALIEGFKDRKSRIISLNLKNNGFSRNGYTYIRQIIASSSLLQLDLSDNRLGNYGISELDILKSSNIYKLNLSNSDMESEGLCNLLHLIKDNKSLTHLILDKNNFQHNWFKRIQDSLALNKSLNVLSMNSCHIKYVDSLFRALVQNHIVTKLELSFNNVSEELESLIDLVKRNNSLKELKLRQCGIEGTKVMNFCSVLNRNVSLTHLDLSDNNLGIDAGKELLKAVLINQSLISLGLEKTQIELSVKMSIDNKLAKNKIEHQRQIRNSLKKESHMLKIKQQSKNVNLPALREVANNNADMITRMKTQIAELNSQLTKKNEDKVTSLNSFDFEMASLNKEIIKITAQSKPGLKELEHQKQYLDQIVKQLNETKEKELEIVKKLERQLQIQRDNIKILENKLEKQLDNEKYLNKRNNSNTKLPLILVKPESPVKPLKAKIHYKQIKTISKIEVVRPHH